MSRVDNNVVTLVSTMHDPNESVVKNRRRPRTTQTNRHHVRAVWGDDPVKPIAIPKVVDDYNHWKVGVDVMDQLLAVLFPDLRCRRTWMPLMIQALMTMRVNAYTAHKYVCTHPRSHKEFTLCWMKCLMRRATKLVRVTRNSIIHSVDQSSPRRFRMSTKNPRLPNARLDNNLSHAAVINPRQGKCVYCRYKYLCQKIERPDDNPSSWGTVGQPMRKCIGCNVYLCRACFDPYHSQNN